MEVAALGPMHSASFAEDPKHLGFVLARYKFVAKMLHGYANVLEVGCGDTTGARIVKAEVGRLVGIDTQEYSGERCISVHRHDMTQRPFSAWDAIYALDVLEHIPPQLEADFLRNIVRSLRSVDGVAIFGTPSLESQTYASRLSREHHVNCKTEQDFRDCLRRFFGNVFVFGMQDEVLHCGYGPMAHYRLALCTNPL